MPRTAKELTDAYYAEWQTGSWKAGKVDLHLFDPVHFQFRGPIDHFDDRAAYANALMEKVGQHLDFGTIHHQFIDGNNVCTIYSFKVGEAEVPTAEWIVAADGYIKEITLMFDPRKLLG